MRSHKAAVLKSGNEPSSLDEQNTYAYWPPNNSSDERNVRSLIKRCSEPNVETWVKLPGKLKGVYGSLAEAEEALLMICGETATESEAGRLALVGEAAARKNRKSVVHSSSSQSKSGCVSAKTQAAKRKLHIADAADNSVSVKSAKMIPEATDVPEKPTVIIPPGTCTETATSSFVEPAVQSSSPQPATEQNLSTNAIPVAIHSSESESVSNVTDQSAQAGNMSDARRKLIDLCARTGSIPPAVPKLRVQQLGEHSGNASKSSGGVMDALHIINSNITSYMVGYWRINSAL